jgi:hypothetical protein
MMHLRRIANRLALVIISQNLNFAATLQVPSLLSYGQLRLHRFWDPLRGDPRFEKLAEESKKPVAMK